MTWLLAHFRLFQSCVEASMKYMLVVHYVSSHCYRFPSYKVKEVTFLIILPINFYTNSPRRMTLHGLLGGLLDHEHEGITNTYSVGNRLPFDTAEHL